MKRLIAHLLEIRAAEVLVASGPHERTFRHLGQGPPQHVGVGHGRVGRSSGHQAETSELADHPELSEQIDLESKLERKDLGEAFVRNCEILVIVFA